MAGKMLETLEDEVKCPLCLDVFSSPRMLPCQHVFCEPCLQAVVVRGSKAFFKCPVCQKHIPLDGFSADQFPPAIQTNRFIDVYQKVLGSAAAVTALAVPPTISEASARTCNMHTSQTLALFCETCDKLVCRDCVITSCSKRDHSYDFLHAIEMKLKATLQEKMAPVKDLYWKITMALEAMEVQNQDMKLQKDLDIAKINVAFDTLSKLLENERSYFLSVTERRFQQQLTKQQELIKAEKELKCVISSIKEKVKREEGIVLEWSEVQKLKSSLENSIDLNPAKLPELSMNIITETQLKEILEERNYFTLAQSDLSANISLGSLEIGKTFTATFTIPDSREVFEISSSMVLCRDGSSEAMAVTRESDVFTITYKPQRIGRHVLNIVHNGEHLCGSPLPVFISMDHLALDYVEPLQVHYSECIGVVKSFGSDVYVTKAKKAIDKIDLSPNARVKPLVLKTIPAEGIIEFTIHDNYIFMTTSKERIIKMDFSTKVLATAGGKGFLPGLFHAINSIKVNSADEVFVCDSKNNRIQIFDINLSFLRTFGKKGQGPGEFNMPDDLDFDKKGSVYVAEEMNHRIQVLSPLGIYIRFISHEGSGPGDLLHPISIFRYREHLYVTDSGNNRVSVFTVDGSHVTSFGTSVLSFPESITVDRDGFIYITDNRRTLVRY